MDTHKCILSIPDVFALMSDLETRENHSAYYEIYGQLILPELDLFAPFELPARRIGIITQL